MSILSAFLFFWLIFVISLYHAWGQEPIMELYAPDVNNVTKTSECKDGLLNDVDFFTVRGKVNKNGANSDAYKDTNLYLQAVKDPSTNAWVSQCRPDLTVCGSTRTTDCYCERKDANGDYHIVMTIMAKSIYSGGKLMLSWNDARSPFNPPILSNQVDYYPGIISDQPKLTSKVWSTEITYNQNVDPNIFRNYTAELCLENLQGILLLEIKENGNTLPKINDSCVTLSYPDTSPSGVWTVSYTESAGCERTGVIQIAFTIESDRGLEGYQIALIVIGCCLLLAFGGLLSSKVFPSKRFDETNTIRMSSRNSSTRICNSSLDSKNELKPSVQGGGYCEHGGLLTTVVDKAFHKKESLSTISFTVKNSDTVTKMMHNIPVGSHGKQGGHPIKVEDKSSPPRKPLRLPPISS